MDCRIAALLRSANELVGPNPETQQRVGSKCLGDWNVGGIAALRDQDATDPGNVVTWIECVPATTDISLEPAGEIAGGIWRRHADVTEIAGAVARRNVHAAAERHSQMCIVPANAFAFVEQYPSGGGRLV